MAKIKNFIKTYKKYIIIGLIIGMIISVLWAVYLLIREDTTPVEIKTIESPFLSEEENTSIVNYDLLSIPSELPIYSILQPDDYLATEFVDQFNKSDETLSETEDNMVWNFENNYFIYDKNASLMYIVANGGIDTSLSSGNISVIQEYLKSILNNLEIVNISTKILENDHLQVKGNFAINDLEIGSIYLGGYSVIAEFDSDGNLYKLDTLLLNTSNISEYQTMPLSSISDLLSISKYPKYINMKEYDEAYSDLYGLLKVSTKINEIDVAETSIQYIFMDYNYGYILPMYILSGEAQLEDSQGDIYWADVDAYLCSITPDYLTDKVEEEIELVDVGVE